MEYRRLGKAGVKVSAISIGAWLTYGSESVAYETAKACIHKAVEHGVNFIDVADAYERGKAEEAVGKILKDYKRSDLVISTKAFWPMSDNVNDQGLSRKHVFESIHKSLKRFDTDYIDIFFCHRFDPNTPVEETIRTLDDLVRQGKILYWGTSMWTAANITEAVATADAVNAYRPVTEQPRYNMLDRDLVEGELETTVAQYGIGLVVFSPLSQGLLTGKYNNGIPQDSRVAQLDWVKNSQYTEERIEKVRAVSQIAQEMGTTPASLALAWAMKHPAVSSVITGATSPTQVEENLKALDIKITDEIEAKIEEALQNRPQNSHR
jgi:voltage-dependent potassium channel beta subunit